MSREDNQTPRQSELPNASSFLVFLTSLVYTASIGWWLSARDLNYLIDHNNLHVKYGFLKPKDHHEIEHGIVKTFSHNGTFVVAKDSLGMNSVYAWVSLDAIVKKLYVNIANPYGVVRYQKYISDIYYKLMNNFGTTTKSEIAREVIQRVFPPAPRVSLGEAGTGSGFDSREPARAFERLAGRIKVPKP